MAEKKGSVKRYPCILCGQEGFSEHQMKAHIALEHFESDAACPFCDARCQSPARLIQHINKTHPEIFRSSNPKEDRNISAFQSRSTEAKKRSKRIRSMECFQRDGDDSSSDETSRFDPVGIPTTLRLSGMEMNESCKCKHEDGKESLSDSSLNTEEVNKLMIRKIRASGGSEHSKRSGATHSEPCAGRCQVPDAAPGKYFFERDRTPAKEKRPPCESTENDSYKIRQGKSSARKNNLNYISDESGSDEQVVNRREVSKSRRGKYGSYEDASPHTDRNRRSAYRDNQSSSDVRQPPFGGERTCGSPGCRQDKARHEKSRMDRDREKQNDRPETCRCTSPGRPDCQQHEFNCPICPFGTDSRQSIIAHVQDRHAEELDGKQDSSSHSCPICTKKFPTAETLQSHVHAVHKDVLKTPESKRKKPEAPVPSGQEPGAIRKNAEARDALGPNKKQQGIYSAAKADPSLYKSSSSSATSNTRIGPDRLMACPMCGIIVANREDLVHHLAWVHPEQHTKSASVTQKTYCCLLCDAEFGHHDDLQTHVQKVHYQGKAQLPDRSAQEQSSSATQAQSAMLKSQVELQQQRRGSQIRMHSYKNVTTSNKHPSGSFDSEIQDAVCPVCQKSLPRISVAGFQAHIDSHFAEESLHQGETSGAKVCQGGGTSCKDFWSNKRYNTMVAHIRGPVELDQMQFQHHCFPHSKVPGLDDGISRTEGIIERLQEYYHPAMPDNVAHVWLCAPIAHYASTAADRGWGCGYRNFQMVISCLLERREYYAALLQGGGKAKDSELPNSQPRPGYMPSIGRIQAMLEEAWREGFDQEGLDQLDGAVFDTCKWIGATELVAIFSHCGIKTKLADFPQPSGSHGTHPALFKWVLNYFTSPMNHVRPPLYLQHQGHSRTIIGIEQLNNGDLRLLVFDPGKETKVMDRFKWNLKTSTVNMIRRSLCALKARQYQILALDGFLTEEEREASKVIRSERIM